MATCEAVIPALTEESLDRYFQAKLDQKVSPTAVAKYRTSLLHLNRWLGEDKSLTPLRLLQWRRAVEESGYSKITVQHYVTHINDYLRHMGRPELCIPKAFALDLRGQVFGYLTAVEPVPRQNRRDVLWRCRCKCGKETRVSAVSLTQGNTTSCGCLNAEILHHHNRYEEGTALRQAMEERIFNPASASGYVGVQPKRGKWTASITYKKKRYNLGTYSNIEDAIKARARAKEAVMEDAARIYAETAHRYGESPHRPPPPERIPPAVPEPKSVLRHDNTSGCTGVSLSRGKWNAFISYKGTRYRLGAFADIDDAIAARQRAQQLLTENPDQLAALYPTRSKNTTHKELE